MSDRKLLVETTLDLALDRARDRARENMVRWGLQDAATLILCMAEELGEVSREQIAIKLNAGTDPRAAVEGAARLGMEALDLAALCLQLIVLAEICVAPEISARVADLRREEAERAEGGGDRRLDSTDYSLACGACLDAHWRPTERAEGRRLFCQHEHFVKRMTGQREIPVGDTPPAWCPLVHSSFSARVGEGLETTET